MGAQGVLTVCEHRGRVPRGSARRGCAATASFREGYPHIRTWRTQRPVLFTAIGRARRDRRRLRGWLVDHGEILHRLALTARRMPQQTDQRLATTMSIIDRWRGCRL